MKAGFLIILLFVLGFVIWHFARLDLPREVSLSAASGESISGNLIGLEDNILTIEARDSTRTTLERKDLSPLDKLMSWRYRESPAPSVRFPIKRTITSSDGRSFEGEITGKTATAISVTRTSDNQTFVIPIESLSPGDIAFARTLPEKESEEYAAAVVELKKSARLQGRQAVWHRDLNNALSESRQCQLPIVLVFKSSEGVDSGDIDKNVFQSSEFRTWANQNAVLCLYYGRTGLETATKPEGVILARRYKVRKTPAVVLLDENGEKLKGSKVLKGYKGEMAGPFIEKIEAEIADSRS